MTEWDATRYARLSALQQAMAAEVLALLELSGDERVLDVGCGNGRVTAEIATRLEKGLVVGIDPSAEMIDFASEHFGSSAHSNLRFETGDARRIPFRDEFDLVAIGRSLIVNPTWPGIVRRGAWSELQPFNRDVLAELI